MLTVCGYELVLYSPVAGPRAVVTAIRLLPNPNVALRQHVWQAA